MGLDKTPLFSFDYYTYYTSTLQLITVNTEAAAALTEEFFKEMLRQRILAEPETCQLMRDHVAFSLEYYSQAQLDTFSSTFHNDGVIRDNEALAADLKPEQIIGALDMSFDVVEGNKAVWVAQVKQIVQDEHGIARGTAEATNWDNLWAECGPEKISPRESVERWIAQRNEARAGMQKRFLSDSKYREGMRRILRRGVSVFNDAEKAAFVQSMTPENTSQSAEDVIEALEPAEFLGALDAAESIASTREA